MRGGSNEAAAWYDRSYEEGRPQSHSKRYETYLDSLQVAPGERVLDVGCGDGEFLRLAATYKLETYGIDVSEKAIALAKERSPTSTLLVSDAAALSFPPETFHHVIFGGSLEHCEDMRKVLLEVWRVLKPGGRVCAVVPNRDFLVWKFTTPGTSQREIIEHLLSLQEWGALFQSSGFRVVRCGKEHWYWKAPRFLPTRLGRYVEGMLLRLLWFVLPRSRTYNLQFNLAK
jgi:ubiquinone/menaquinone biosynthesis C-methylase UbiE